MKLLIVGGTFDENGGKPSKLIAQMQEFFRMRCEVVGYYNGGNYQDIESIIQECQKADVTIWMPNVPNDKAKIRNVKEINPKTLLILSKRNDGSKYPFAEIVNRMLKQKSNLLIHINKQENGIFSFQLLDPLGNCWCDTEDFSALLDKLYHKTKYLLSITRQSTYRAAELGRFAVGYHWTDEQIQFLDTVKKFAEIFHEKIKPAEGVTRFLGNSSFRCQKGFPSFRATSGVIFVSKRNVDKRYIDKENFMPVKFHPNGDICYGFDKPSVDTPIQVRLYELFPNINFMVHTHCYVNAGVFTKNNVPCGGIEEVQEILDIIPEDERNGEYFAINLKGHGCLVMAKTVEQIEKVAFVERVLPEMQE